MYYDQFKKLSENYKAHLLRELLLKGLSFHTARKLYDALIEDSASLLKFAKQAKIITGEYGDRYLAMRSSFFIKGNDVIIKLTTFTNDDEKRSYYPVTISGTFSAVRSLVLTPMYVTINEYQLKGMSINYCGNAYSGKYASELSAIVLADEVLFEAVIFALQQNKELTDD